MERVVIFGSTGMTGTCAVEAAVQKGLNVRAFVRDPAKLSDYLRDSVEVVKGNVLNYIDVYNSIKNVTAVVVALGTRNDLSPTTDMSEGLKNIVKAMKELDVKILSVCISAFLFYEPDKVPERYRPLTVDHQRMLDLIKESNLNYIAVLPPHISDDSNNQYEIKYDSSPGRVISKHALGKFLIDCLTQPVHFGKIVGIHTKAQ